MNKDNKKSKNIEEHLINDYPFIGPISSTDLNFEFKDKSHMEAEIKSMRKKVEEKKKNPDK